jgi:hypothetical protein
MLSTSLIAELEDAVKSGSPETRVDTLRRGTSLFPGASERLIVACKAGKLTWPTVARILKARFSHHSVSQQELEAAKTAFIIISQAAAQRSMRFMQVHETAKKAG